MKNKIIIEKMINYTNKLLSYAEGVNYDDFENNTMLVEACVFNLGQIGELANKIEKEFESQHDEIPWRVLYGLRNKIIHDYEGVNLKLIWEILESDLLELKCRLELLIEKL